MASTDRKKRKASPLMINQEIQYKDIELLKTFITEHGKILPRRRTNLTVKQQKNLKKAVKRARILSLLPFVLKDKN
uniref:Small ribosomal subunit protein bS18c n=1 Tax=Rhizochromulina marina TaxID=1034831 RepID=A0A514CPZ2_9STRA|nr:ribosomal protein S18 [Rhizochromulina marina]QDH81878.1 ribosomal protein S18 [Rhizochromulina marina]